MKTIISPSILASDFSRLGEEVSRVEKGGAEWLHIDVMDGVFVPNISYGAPVYRCVRKRSSLFFDVHLMITEPIRYIRDFASAGAQLITVHVEAACDVRKTLNAVHELGLKAGLSLKPGTPAESLFPYLNDVDLILVMSVEPGFGGQSFMPDMLDKVRAFRDARRERGLGYLIEIDGGINGRNAPLAIKAGTDVLVAGSSIFKADDYGRAIRELRGEPLPDPDSND